MKLRALAEKASQLPILEFDWAGEEQIYNNANIKSHKSLVDHIAKLRYRMQLQTSAIVEIMNAYNLLRELILDADIEDAFSLSPSQIISKKLKSR